MLVNLLTEGSLKTTAWRGFAVIKCLLSMATTCTFPTAQKAASMCVCTSRKKRKKRF